jgi:FdrA protein
VSWHVRVIPNRYADSVRLMSISRSLRERDGVRGCELGMGTRANIEFLAALGARADASPADVVIAVEADAGDAAPALALAEQELASLQPRDGGAAQARARPRSLPVAARDLPHANVALISVPGEYAALEAHQALSAGMHVFLFSDHVPLATELELKRRAAGLGLLVMGPECGTAMLAGVGLGFANVVRPGRVGIVAAAGTGAQECACLLDAAGSGVSHIVGVGGRDLSSEVGGIMFREGMRMLAADENTDTLLLVSKTPSPDAVAAVAQAVPADKRAVAAFVGWDRGEASFEIHPTLESGAAAAAQAPPIDPGPIERELDARGRPGPPGSLLGLYSGGSLAHEAATILEPALGPLAGNVGHGPPDPGSVDADGPPDGERPAGHRVLDLGEERYTQGRPHPMVDLGTRVSMLERAADDDRVSCVLLDVVLGHSGHPDPAGGLAAAVARVCTRALVIAHVCGTPDDPQDSRRQAQTLAEAGALVAPSNAAAARLALRALR